MLRRKILIQLSSKNGIYKLNPPADPKYGLVVGDGLFQYDGFHPIPFFTAVNEIFQRFFVIDHWRDIMPAGKQKTIAHPHELP